MLKTPGDEFKSAGQFEDPEFGFDRKNIGPTRFQTTYRQKEAECGC